MGSFSILTGLWDLVIWWWNTLVAMGVVERKAFPHGGFSDSSASWAWWCWTPEDNSFLRLRYWSSLQTCTEVWVFSRNFPEGLQKTQTTISTQNDNEIQELLAMRSDTGGDALETKTRNFRSKDLYVISCPQHALPRLHPSPECFCDHVGCRQSPAAFFIRG